MRPGPLSGAARTPPFPARPIRILVGFAAGGARVIARILAQKLSEGPLSPVLVDNRTGASGLIAADCWQGAARRHHPDGGRAERPTAVAPILYSQ